MYIHNITELFNLSRVDIQISLNELVFTVAVFALILFIDYTFRRAYYTRSVLPAKHTKYRVSTPITRKLDKLQSSPIYRPDNLDECIYKSYSRSPSNYDSDIAEAVDQYGSNVVYTSESEYDSSPEYKSESEFEPESESDADDLSKYVKSSVVYDSDGERISYAELGSTYRCGL